VAGIARFRSRHAFTRHNGTAPTPVWSGSTERHRPSRAGSRQLNAAIHRVALTRARSWTDARDYLDRRQEAGATGKEAIRPLKRRISDTTTVQCSPTPNQIGAVSSTLLDIGETGLIYVRHRDGVHLSEMSARRVGEGELRSAEPE
jgi:hypothetical protein